MANLDYPTPATLPMSPLHEAQHARAAQLPASNKPGIKHLVTLGPARVVVNPVKKGHRTLWLLDSQGVSLIPLASRVTFFHQRKFRSVLRPIQPRSTPGASSPDAYS